MARIFSDFGNPQLLEIFNLLRGFYPAVGRHAEYIPLSARVELLGGKA